MCWQINYSTLTQKYDVLKDLKMCASDHLQYANHNLLKLKIGGEGTGIYAGDTLQCALHCKYK